VAAAAEVAGGDDAGDPGDDADDPDDDPRESDEAEERASAARLPFVTCMSLPFIRRWRQNVLPVARVKNGSSLVLAAMVTAATVVGGCGRRATESDCQLIVNKSVELQMKEMSLTNASAVAKREAQVRAEMQGEIESCEGRRVSSKTMACVQGATSSQELDRCLR
jgi:hypothetical protein